MKELKNENLQLSCANNENEDVNANAMNYTHGRLDVDALDQGLRAQPVVAFSNGISSDRLLRNVEVEQEQHRLQRGDRDLVATIDGNMENRVDRLKERPANRAETSEGANDERLHLSIIEQSAEDQNNESELFNDSNGDAKVSLSTCQSTTNNESYVATTSLEANYGDVDVIDLPESNPVTGESYCNGGPRQIPNSCAICLSSYDIGRTLVWSANVSCPHAFHEDCITTWCIRKMEENPQASTCLCPCCRQSFVAVDL